MVFHSIVLSGKLIDVQNVISLGAGDAITLKVSQGYLTRVFSATFGGFFSTPDVESIHVSNTGK